MTPASLSALERFDDESGPRSRDVAGFPILAAAGLLALDGSLMLLVGSTSLLPRESWAAPVPVFLVGAGLSLAALALLAMGRKFAALLRTVTPRLFPLAPTAVNAGFYFVLILSGVSVVHSVFDVLTGAHNGGNLAALSDQDDLNALLLGESFVIWLVTTYMVLTVTRAVRMGRFVDAVTRSDPYGWEPPPSTAPPVRARAGGNENPRPVPRSRILVLATSVVLAVGISAAFQILEVNVAPAPALDWLAAQIVTPIWASMFASAILLIDRGIRRLEDRYLLAVAEFGGVKPSVAPAI